MFKPFSKLGDNKNLNPSGNGLGLNICKLICKSLGGDIKVQSNPPVTKFKFWVAIQEPKECDVNDLLTPGREVVLQSDREVTTMAKMNLKALLKEPVHIRSLLKKNLKLSIVCADDEYYNNEALRLVFQSLGLLEFCQFKSNGKEVVDLCKEIIFNGFNGPQKQVLIVMVDFEMPIMTGLQAIKELKAIYRISYHNEFFAPANGDEAQLPNPNQHCLLPMPKCVMFSAHIRKGFSEFLKNEGVDYIIDKPPNQEEIFKILVSATDEARQQLHAQAILH